MAWEVIVSICLSAYVVLSSTSFGHRGHCAVYLVQLLCFSLSLFVPHALIEQTTIDQIVVIIWIIDLSLNT